MQCANTECEEEIKETNEGDWLHCTQCGRFFDRTNPTGNYDE
jgi:hypothetical protein